MKKEKSKNAGITLIAMIITIIVMLVLAGVSMNAIIGDNGILSNAINATTATSIAVLQEYLQELYVENYDSLNTSDSKVAALSNLSKYSGYFYNPSTDSGVGSLSYVVDSDGHSLYLIKKSGLPEEIQKQLVGGDAGDGTYSDYVSLNDVYGVTYDLEVYYCSSGVNSIQGLTVADLDEDDPARPVTIDSNLANLLKIDANTTALTLRAYKTLTIDSTVSSLSDLYNFSNLQVLILDGAKLSSLSGIENCPLLYEVYCKSSTVGDYTAVGKLGSRLTHLYFYNINDAELETACSNLSSYDLPKLTYLAIVGNTSYISSTTAGASSSKSSLVYSVSALNNLTSTTKQAVTYLSLQNNYLSSLDGISGFTGVTVFRCEYNLLTNLDDISAMSNLKYLICGYNSDLAISSNLKNTNLYLLYCNYCTSITSLSFLENCSSITYIYANYCTIGYGETSTKNEETDSLAVLDGKTSLYYLSLTYNTNLAWIDYINSCSKLTYLYLEGCTGLNSISMYAIKTLIASLGTNCSYPTTYSLALLDDDTTLLDLTGETLTQDEFETIGEYTKITHLSLKNVVIQDDDENEIKNTDDAGNTTNELNTLVTDVLSELTAMKYLQLYGMSNLSTIDFVENMEGLLELDIRDTSITDLSLLETMTKNENIDFTLNSLGVNNSYINLSLIPETINLLGTQSSNAYWLGSVTGSYTGITCDNSTTWNSLAGSSIERLFIGYRSDFPEVVDLSSCSKLSEVYARGGTQKNLTLPVNLDYLQCMRSAVNLLSGSSIDTLYLFDSGGYASSVSILECISSLRVLYLTNTSSYLSLLTYTDGTGIEEFYAHRNWYADDLTNLVVPSTLKILSIGDQDSTVGLGTFSNFPSSIVSPNGNSLKKIIIRSGNLTSVEFLSDFTLLEEIDLCYNYITSLDGISSLENLTELSASDNLITSLEQVQNLSKLEYINLKNNYLTGLYGIQSLTNLTTLYLNNNSLVNVASYNGNYNNLELLIDLLEAGTLKTLNISNNSSINKETTQWTTLLSYNGTNGIKITY